MSSIPVARVGGAALRRSLHATRIQTTSQTFLRRLPAATRTNLYRCNVAPSAMTQSMHSSAALKGLMPETENPPPKESEDIETPTVPTDISTEEFHERADEFLEDLVTRLETAQDKLTDVDVEYSAGVVEVALGDKGTYVLNKQPNNKQIWLSSPVSGPKRFDWVMTGEGLDQKEGGGVADWIYLRDGTSLSEIIRKELGVDLSIEGDAPQ